jgi:hypothetical protein
LAEKALCSEERRNYLFEGANRFPSIVKIVFKRNFKIILYTNENKFLRITFFTGLKMAILEYANNILLTQQNAVVGLYVNAIKHNVVEKKCIQTKRT